MPELLSSREIIRALEKRVLCSFLKREAIRNLKKVTEQLLFLIPRKKSPGEPLLLYYGSPVWKKMILHQIKKKESNGYSALLFSFFLLFQSVILYHSFG